MKVIEDIKLDFSDVLIKPKSSEMASRKAVELERTFESKYSNEILRCCPIFASNMAATGTFAMARSLEKFDWLTCLHKHYTVDELVNFYYWEEGKTFQNDLAWYSMGLQEDDFKKLYEFRKRLGDLDICGHNQHWMPNICIDVANLYSDALVDKLAKVREISYHSWIMAGNVATPEMVERIIRQGKVDIVKVGIGPGSACTTRLVTGVGYPMLSCVLECADAAHGSSGGYICADGGCQHPGDVCKAFGANADFVMCGGLLAGCDECDGEWEHEYLLDGNLYGSKDTWVKSEDIWPVTRFGQVKDKRKKYLKFYGMSSHKAQEKHNGGIKDYRSSEGRVIEVPYKGPVENVVKDIEGGIRSCCTYIGARRIKDLGKCTTFLKVNRVHNNMDR